MAVPNVPAQKLVKKALMKLGVVNRLDVLDQDQLADGLDGMWQLLDSFNGQNYLIPFITHISFDVTANKRIYTYGEGGDFDSPRPLEIIAASWLDAAGNEWPINIVETQLYVAGNPYKNSDVGRPYQMYYEPSYPTAQIFFASFPQPDDTLLLKVKLPFSAEICACCDDGSECDTGCVDPNCENGNVNPDDYTITVAGCPAGDDACVLSGQTQMSSYLETQCSTDCDQTYEQDFQYDPGGGDITITATAVRTPRIVPRPTQLALTENTEFPPAYQNLIIWCLAEFMAPEYNMEPPAIVSVQADKAKRHMKGRNSRPNELRADRALTAPRGVFSIYSGWFGG